MDFGALFLILGLALLVGLYIAQPLLRPMRRAGQSSYETELSALLARRDTIVSTLEDLEMDFELGKLSEAAYLAQKKALLKKGAEILERLDALTATMSTKSATDRLQEAVRQRRRASRIHIDDDLEALLEQRRRQRQQQAVGFCPHCGAPVLQSDRFCPKCGTELQESSTS
ncbi:MAG TPA: zinc-ribbon domain-containing protein [Anaerolineae bacterium]|nr:zinc-ribbon domain-containing protein [Anaerolineae bacterium]HID84002.1 zinc-ribbon domain-containing protein [Anaerolineales bacterium]HIQ09847.1 zinc-ribbon domain-containing protein [Anaerolineaceae bacterium]